MNNWVSMYKIGILKILKFQFLDVSKKGMKINLFFLIKIMK